MRLRPIGDRGGGINLASDVDMLPVPAAVAGMLPRRQAIARASVSALVASLPLLYVSLLRPPPAALAGDTAFWFLMSNCVIAAIVATSGDASALLFKSAPDDDGDPRDAGGGLSCASAGQSPVAAVQGINSDAAMVPSPASSSKDEPLALDMNGDRVHGQVASAVASIYSLNRPLPPLAEGEEEDAASEPSAKINHPVQQRGEEEEEEEVAIEPSAKNCAIEVEAQGEEDGEVIPLVIIEEGFALAEPAEPWPRAVRSTRSLPVEEASAAREGELRRSATVGSKPATDQESEYWQLSDEELNRRVEDFIARFNREMRLQIEQEAGA